jgi:hypothetical protein
MVQLLSDPNLEKKCNERNYGDDNLLLDPDTPFYTGNKKKANKD